MDATLEPKDAALMKGQPVLVAVDGSPASDAAILTALELAASVGSPVRFIHGSSTLSQRLYADSAAEGPDQEQIVASDPELADALAHAMSARVDAVVEILDGPRDTDAFAAEIAGIADGIGAGMIVCGSRGRSAAAGAVLGSVSHSLIRYATAPVLIVHGVVDARPRTWAAEVAEDGSREPAREYSAASCASERKALATRILR